MSRDDFRQDSLIFRASHFKQLCPTPLAEQIHRLIAAQLGPILANAAMRLAADRTGVGVDMLTLDNLPRFMPLLAQQLRRNEQSAALILELEALAKKEPTSK